MYSQSLLLVNNKDQSIHVCCLIIPYRVLSRNIVLGGEWEVYPRQGSRAPPTGKC